METPPSNIGRRTRHALAEIPARIGTLSVADFFEERRPLINSSNIQNGSYNLNNGLSILSTNINIAEALTPRGISNRFLTPSPSPEELVIQQRGRRRIPVTFSPDIDELKKETQARDRKDHTPVKLAPGSPGRSSIVLRSTPRKRLLLTDTTDATPLSPSPKKPKIDDPIDTNNTAVTDILKLFSADQLISVISQLTRKHPYIESDIKSLLPKPDLRALEDNLNYLKRNIFKSLPRCRLVSKTDASAYNRASTHVLAFKKCVLESGQRFLESKQWSWIMEYFAMAWKSIRSTPVWDNPSHNISRKQCFRTLGTYCMTALKNGQFTADQLKHYQIIITGFLVDNEDLQQCLKQIEKHLKP